MHGVNPKYLIPCTYTESRKFLQNLTQNSKVFTSIQYYLKESVKFQLALWNVIKLFFFFVALSVRNIVDWNVPKLLLIYILYSFFFFKFCTKKKNSKSFIYHQMLYSNSNWNFLFMNYCTISTDAIHPMIDCLVIYSRMHANFTRKSYWLFTWERKERKKKINIPVMISLQHAPDVK